MDLGDIPGYKLAVRGQYDEHYKALTPEGSRARRLALAPYLARVLAALDLPEEGWLLELGTGDGLLAREVAARRPAMQVLGVDASEPALALAKQVAAADGLRNAHFTIADAESPPDAQFERCAALSLFNLLPDKRAALRSWRERATPAGARLVITDGFTLRDAGTLGAGAASHGSLQQASRAAKWRLTHREDLTPLARKLALKQAWPWTEYLRDGFRYELLAFDAI